MNQRDSLRETMRQFRLKASVLSRASGVQERQISLFLSGKDIRSDTLLKLVVAADKIAPGARTYFCSHLAGEPLADTNWRALISTASVSDIEEVMKALTDRWACLSRSEEISQTTDRELVSLSA